MKLIAADEGTLDVFWEKPADGLGNHLVYFGMVAPGTPAASVTIAAPGDADSDGIPDALDKCMLDSRNATITCDTDSDGYGNVCDADFNQSFLTNVIDFNMYKASEATGVPSPEGTDMNCNGSVGSIDFTMFFLPKYTGLNNKPGPSGLACAGTVPCP